MKTLCAGAAHEPAVMSALQIGLEWFPDGIGGGSGRFFAMLADSLPAAKVTVHGIATGKASIPRRQCNGIKLMCGYNEPLHKRVCAARNAIRDILETQKIDIVASHFALFTAGSLDILKRLPLVVHFHGPWAAESRVEGASQFVAAAQYVTERLVYARAQKAIVLTRAFRDVLHRTYRVPLENISVIPGGVDVQRFNVSTSKADARLRLGLPLDRPVVLTVRRLAKRMGLENLLSAFEEVHRRHRDVLLVVVGGGRLLDALKGRVCNSRLIDGVVFTGRVPEGDLPLYYRAADLSIVPSIALEGFGLVVAESLACGTPALVTPVGGLPEAVSGLSDHLILENCGVSAITEGLEGALFHTLRLPSPQACAQYARENFAWPVIAHKVKSVYEQVVCA